MENKEISGEPINKEQAVTTFWHAYNFELKNRNTVSHTGLTIYAEHYLMAAIINSFITREKLSFKDLNEYVWNYVPKEFTWSIPANASQKVIIRMIRLGYIEVEPKDESNPYSLNFRITKLGITTLQAQTLQSLAATSFFNYQAHKFNKRSFLINLLAILVAILSLVLTMATLFDTTSV